MTDKEKEDYVAKVVENAGVALDPADITKALRSLARLFIPTQPSSLLYMVKICSLKGEQLGYLTNEIPEGLEMVAVIVMALKVYGLKMQDKKLKLLLYCEGERSHFWPTKTINFDSMDKTMKDFISTGHAEALGVKQSTFLRRDHALDGLWTLDKKLTPTLDKGHYDSVGVITPFGSLAKGTKLIDDYPFYN